MKIRLLKNVAILFIFLLFRVSILLQKKEMQRVQREQEAAIAIHGSTANE